MVAISLLVTRSNCCLAMGPVRAMTVLDEPFETWASYFFEQQQQQQQSDSFFHNRKKPDERITVVAVDEDMHPTTIGSLDIRAANRASK